MPRRGLHISIGAAIFVLFAIYLAQNPPPPSYLTAQLGTLFQQEEPEQRQEDALFIPFVEGNNDGQAAAEQESVEQEAAAEPAPIESATSLPQEPTPEAEETPVFYSFEEETRGEIITILDKDIQLPEDAYIFGVMTGISPDPNVLNSPMPPLTVLKRKDATLSIENSTGRIFLWMPEDVARCEFDFLVQALGEDKIFIPEYQFPPNPQPEVTDAPQP